MSIEESTYEQMEFDLMGEYPVIPVWEKTVDELIVDDTTEVSSVYRKPQFQEDLLEGFI